MEYLSMLGGEQEFFLTDLEGKLRDVADEVLEELQDPGFTKEVQFSSIELVSGPKHTIKELHREETRKLQALERVSRNHGAVPVPTSYFGAGEIKTRSTPRYDGYIPILGADLDYISNTLLGIHSHIDQYPGREEDQHKLITAMSPLGVAITRTSPIRHDGYNTIPCQRVHLFRDVIFVNPELLCQPYYGNSVEEIENMDQRRYDTWAKKWALNTKKKTEEFRKLGFNPENTGYHTPRKRTIGKGTWENRNKDTTILPLKYAACGLEKGANDRMVSEGIPLRVAEGNEPYQFTSGEIVIPSLEQVAEFGRQATHDKKLGKEFLNYLAAATAFAKEGLPREDRGYLQPIKQMIRTRGTVSERVMDYMRSRGYHNKQFTPKQAAQAHLFLRQSHVNCLDYRPI